MTEIKPGDLFEFWHVYDEGQADEDRILGTLDIVIKVGPWLDEDDPCEGAYVWTKEIWKRDQKEELYYDSFPYDSLLDSNRWVKVVG